MPTATFTNTARRGFRPDKSWTWGECWQGQYKGGDCGGYLLFDFSALGNLANISISAIRMTFSVGAVGGSYTKYLYLHVNGYNGAGAGSYKFTQLYNTTRSLAFSAGSNAAGFAVLRDYILGGGTTIGIGASGTRGKQDGKDFDYDYLSLTGMTLEITYEYLKSEGSVGAAQTGGSATMAITAYNSAYSHRVTWRLGDWSATQDVAAGTASASCQIPHSALPNAVSGTATAELETLNGGTSLGSNVYSFPVTVPAGVVPAIGSLTVSPVNAGASSTAAGWGLFIQDRTRASAAMGGVSAGSGASIAAYSLTTSPDYGGAAAASLTTGLLSAAGTVTITAVVTDSRGRTATRTATITVQAYAPPQITGTPSVYRCTSDGTRDDTGGTYAKLTAGFSCSGVNGQNSLTVRRVALNGANTDLTSGAAAVIGAGGLSPDNTYQAVITLTDAVGSTTTYTVAIPSAAYLMHFAKGGRSIGIGCAANSTPDDTVHVGWPLHLANNTWNPVGDDVYIGDCNQAGCLGIKGRNGETGLWFVSQDGQTAAKMHLNGINVALSTTFVAPRLYASGHIDTDGDFRAWKNNACKVRLWADDEGGNIAIFSPDGHEYQIDAFNNTCIRLYAFDDNNNIHSAYWWRDSGTLSVERVYVSDALSTRTNLGAALGTYTSGEVQTGGKWIDGKTIYRYTLSGATTGTGDINLGAALPRTPDNVISFTGALHDGTNWRPLPHTTYYSLNQMCGMALDGNNAFHLYTQLSGTKKYNIAVDYTA